MAPIDVSLRREELQHHGRGVPGRRTITIRGRGSDHYTPPARSASTAWDAPRRRTPRSVVRARTRPDRIAMWAVLLGVMLVLAAATSSHAAVRASGHQRLLAGPHRTAARFAPKR